MKSRKFLLAGAALLPLMAFAPASADSFAGGAPVLLAQADIGEALARLDQARQAVIDAQAALADAEANGGDVATAQANLDDALFELEAAEQTVADMQAAEEETAPPPEETQPDETQPADETQQTDDTQQTDETTEADQPPDDSSSSDPAGTEGGEQLDEPPGDQPPVADTPPTDDAGTPPADEGTSEPPGDAGTEPPADSSQEQTQDQPVQDQPSEDQQSQDQQSQDQPSEEQQSQDQQTEDQQSEEQQSEEQQSTTSDQTDTGARSGTPDPNAPLSDDLQDGVQGFVRPSQGSETLPSEDVPPPPPPGESFEAPPPPPPTGAAAEPVGTQTEQGEVVEQGEAGRTIFRTEDNQLIIQHNDQNRIERGARDVETVNLGNGFTASILTRNSGVQIITVRDPDGNIIQRVRREPDGQETVLIGGPEPDRQIYYRGEFRQDFRPEDFGPPRGRPDFRFEDELPPLVVPIPEEDYVVEAREATEPQIQEALVAPPVVELPRAYTLDEIRGSEQLRNTVRRIDLDTVTFETGSAAVAPDQIDTLEQIGRALQAVIASDPGQVFLIEGHTDAVGSDLYNLGLSDRRAETVAGILSTYFAIPPENLVTQGYGEQYLKIPTTEAERLNRRVTLRNITNLLQAQN